MYHTIKSLIQENVESATPTKFKGTAAIEDCIANKLIRGSVLDELNVELKLGDIDIQSNQQLTQYCERAISYALGLLLDDEGDALPWLKKDLKKLGFSHENPYNNSERKAVLDAFLFQAVEMSIVKFYGTRKDSHELRMNARRTYKELLGSADRKTGTKINPQITMAYLIKEYRRDVSKTTIEQVSTAEIPEWFDNIFPLLVNDNMTSVPPNIEKNRQGLKQLLINALLTGRAFEYILCRNDIVSVNITDSFELETFVANNIRLALELFFDEQGNLLPWFNRIITMLGFKSNQSMDDIDKRTIIDAFTYQAVENGMIRVFENSGIEDFFVYKMHARQMRKEMIGFADKRTKVAINQSIHMETLLSEYLEPQF